MRKFYLLGLVLIAAMAFGGLTSSSAFALVFESAKWLINGAQVSAELPSEWAGTITMEDTSFGAIECSIIYRSSISIFGIEVYSKQWEALSTGTVTLSAPVSCTSVKNCEAGTATAAPESLPWDGQLSLDLETGTFVVLALGEAYSTRCRVLGITITDECTIAENEVEAKNVTGGVELAANPAPNGNCSLGGANAGVLQILAGNLLTSSEGTVTASE